MSNDNKTLYRYATLSVIFNTLLYVTQNNLFQGTFKTAATSNMEHFVIIVNGFQPLTIITYNSILDVAAVLDTTLLLYKTQCAQSFSEKRGFESSSEEESCSLK